MKKTKQTKKSKQSKQAKRPESKQQKAAAPKANIEQKAQSKPKAQPAPQAVQPVATDQAPMPVLVAILLVVVLLVGGIVWALTRDSEQTLTPSVNNAPTTLKVINSQPTDVPKNQAAPSQAAPQQATGQSLQNAPAPSREDCLAMGMSACN